MSDLIPGALGKASHREGKDTLALGDFSHSEGELTQAQGRSSHAEGINTGSIGQASHAEGEYCIATGEASHAEGYGTVAKNFASNASGVFNKGESNDTIKEIGIGISDSERKNAFEVYKDGQIRTPEQTRELLKVSDGKNISTVEYTHGVEESNSKVVTLEFSDIELDLERERNFTIECDNENGVEVSLKRPLNIRKGYNGTITFSNKNKNTTHSIKFGSYWYGLSFGEEVQLEDKFTNLVISYHCLDENNIRWSHEDEFIPHLPLMVGDDKELLINENGDTLLT